MREIAQGFEHLFGEGSEDHEEISEIFSGLDLDASGNIDYTEFCAAAIGYHATNKDDAIWAAFKTFDTDDDGCISLKEIQRILKDAHVQQAWSQEVCDEMASEAMELFDKDSDGTISFDEWLSAIEKCWQRKHPEHHEVVSAALPPEHKELIHGLTAGGAAGVAARASRTGVGVQRECPSPSASPYASHATYTALQEVGKLNNTTSTLANSDRFASIDE